MVHGDKFTVLVDSGGVVPWRKGCSGNGVHDNVCKTGRTVRGQLANATNW